ncbi:MAG: hypothetical protein H7Y43_02780 [Akkermansiaceae bacterium]|nr:hypothetical protein [Verrucomicrobiales bacterium]
MKLKLMTFATETALRPQPCFRLIVALFALLLGTTSIRAHDPFDSSARMEVREADMEITVTLGLDAARQLLAGAGFSKERVAQLVGSQDTPTAFELPLKIAADFFQISHRDAILAASKLTMLSEGTEVIFTLLYPRPAAEKLTVRAVFYTTIKEMRQGSFVAYNGNGDELGSALLSRASFTVQVLLDARRPQGHEVATPKPAGFARWGIIFVMAGVISLGGYWLAKRTSFFR